MYRRFVLVSGLPGSGKSALARRLAPELNLPMIDKDEILERLFESRGVGDAAWRRRLSRESDAILQAEAMASEGAILVSHWRRAGMAVSSGTPTGWLRELPAHIVHVHCVCSIEVAADRFVQRQRHPGHLDRGASYAQVVARFREMESLGPVEIGRRVDVDTSEEFELDDLVRAMGLLW